jgi:hypothetical protein
MLPAMIFCVAQLWDWMQASFWNYNGSWAFEEDLADRHAMFVCAMSPVFLVLCVMLYLWVWCRLSCLTVCGASVVVWF